MDSATCTREEQPINLHDIYQSERLESQICFFLSLERLKIKGPTRRAKTDKGHLCLKELKLSFDDDYIGWRNSK
jgi:hypothetical protein